VVRILSSPKFTGTWARELQAIFDYFVGKYKRVQAFDEYGQLEIAFRILRQRGSIKKGKHAVWLEPNLVRLKRTRSQSCAELEVG
jgi:hypothetical protein